MIDYFNTPMWKTLMISFIEENCILFVNDDETPESAQEYKKIFEVILNLFY